MAGATEAEREAVRERLRSDYLYYPEVALNIVTKRGERVPFRLKGPQKRLARALMRQREAGQPQRAIILKARQIGMSTLSQGLGIQRATQMPNHLAVTVGQNRETTAALFNIGRFMWANLPEQIRPPAAYESGTVDRKLLQFGEPSLQMRRQGMLGLNSAYETATAKSAAAARGRTIHTLHLSEVAFWPTDGTMLAILQGVPDTPESLVLKESTANGDNAFKDDWELAVTGASGYYAMFSPWFEEDEYRRAFANDSDRAEFEHLVGSGPYGEDEGMLLSLIPEQIRGWEQEAIDAGEHVEPLSDEALETRVLEHLNWRRWCIAAKCEGSVDKFHQEYPSTPDEAFLSTGRKVFDAMQVTKAMRHAEKMDPLVPTLETPGPAVGALVGEEHKAVRARRHVVVDVPQKVVWVPRSRLQRGERAPWRIWKLPQQAQTLTCDPETDGPFWPGQGGLDKLTAPEITPSEVRIPRGQYVVSCDPASDEVDEKGTEHANHAIVVIDHRTRELVAEFEAQGDADEIATQVFLAAKFYNDAWVVVERTGGWGLPILRRLAIDLKYPRLFEQESHDKRAEARSDRLGFSTDAQSKPVVIAEAVTVLKLAADGKPLIPSRRLLQQHLSYVRDERGRMKPEPGRLADVLMAWAIGQLVTQLRPLRPEGKREKSSGGTRTFRSKRDR
jgi:hypothetical protein